MTGIKYFKTLSHKILYFTAEIWMALYNIFLRTCYLTRYSDIFIALTN